MINSNKKATSWIVISLIIILLDQMTKHYVVTHFTEKTVKSIFPFLNFILRFNSGASFSFLGAQNGWQIYFLSAVSIVVSFILVMWLKRLSRSEWMVAFPVSLVLGGAIGNLIDRVRLGYVIDFIDFHVGTWHYATFNVADSAVCVGAIWLVLRLWYESITRKS